MQNNKPVNKLFLILIQLEKGYWWKKSPQICKQSICNIELMPDSSSVADT